MKNDEFNENAEARMKEIVKDVRGKNMPETDGVHLDFQIGAVPGRSEAEIQGFHRTRHRDMRILKIGKPIQLGRLAQKTRKPAHGQEFLWSGGGIFHKHSVVFPYHSILSRTRNRCWH